MANLHYNNHISSKQDANDVAQKLFKLIIESGKKSITLSVDDGDGDIWKYEISIISKIVNQVNQLNEN